MLNEPLTPEEGGLKISGKVLREEGVCLTLCNHLAPQGKWTYQPPAQPLSLVRSRVQTGNFPSGKVLLVGV